MAMPGVLSGLNHSLDIHAWGRSRIPRSSSSSWRLLTQSSSQVPSTVTLRLLRRRLSNCSSDSVSQAYFRRGIGPVFRSIPYLDDFNDVVSFGKAKDEDWQGWVIGV